MRVAVTGSSGLIGTALVDALIRAGHQPLRVHRGADGGLDTSGLAGADAVVHLAGAGIGDRRWNDAYKRLLVDSRVEGTTRVAQTIAAAPTKPAVLVSASAVGWYGDRGDEILDEESPPGQGFLADLCQQWERAADPARAAGIRVVHLRSGIVLSRRGGALKKQLPLFKLGLGGRFGRGQQWQSWIALDDEVSAILHLLTADVTGPVNLTAPQPVRNADFTRTLGAVLHRPTVLPVPAFGPRLLFGRELADVLLFEGQRVLPHALEASGFTFAHPELEGALRALLHEPAPS